MLRQWEVAYPTPAKGLLYAWVVRAPCPAGPTQRERRGKRKTGETEQGTATPTAEPGHLRTLRVAEKKRGCDGVQVVTLRTTTPKHLEGKKNQCPRSGPGHISWHPLNSARGVRTPRRNREVGGR